MRLFRRRDDELRRVYRAHLDAVYAYFAYSVSSADAEDLTSATFERAVRAWPSYDPRRASERTWILAIARNVLIDHFRRQSIRRTVSSDEHPTLLEGLADTEDGLSRVLGPDDLRAWLSCLDDRQRHVMALRYAADLTAADIAAVLGLSPANVHQILSRSLRRLREAASAPDGEERTAGRRSPKSR